MQEDLLRLFKLGLRASFQLLGPADPEPQQFLSELFSRGALGMPSEMLVAEKVQDNEIMD